jgi:general stress protein YciG
MGNSSRGFASMSPDKQREIASKGGKAAHQKGTAHQFTSEEARAAGKKGGQASGVARSKKSDKGISKPVAKSAKAPARPSVETSQDIEENEEE